MDDHRHHFRKTGVFGVLILHTPFIQAQTLSTKPRNINAYLIVILQLILQMRKSDGGKIQVQKGLELIF